MFKQVSVLVLLLHLSWAAPGEPSQNEDDHDCGSDVFCYGDLLEIIQMSEVFDDSETFVKKKMLHSRDDVKKKFDEKKKDLKNDVVALRNFLKENFDEDPLVPFKLSDYKEIEDPQNIIRDKTYLQFYKEIHPTWEKFGVKTNEIPEEVSDRHSMIELPYYFIKTADSQNFPVLWQNYLIVRGLLWNDMFTSASNIINNMKHLWKEGTFIPLTNRVYATKRHQLPLLSFMLEDYLQAYQQVNNNIYDTGFLQKMYPVVEAEFKWWTEKAGAKIEKEDGTKYSLFKYTSYGQEPRPENYKKDHNVAKELASNEEKIRFYSAVRALDETTFGYSSRFLQENKYKELHANLDVERIVPVELNSVLQRCAHLLSDWCERLGKKEAATYDKLAEDIQYGIDKILWSDEHKIWLDYDLQTGKHVNSYFITNLMPLFTLSYDKAKYDPTEDVLDYLLRENIISIADDFNFDFKYQAIPTSNQETGEMSDKPYGSIFWNLLIIDGLRETNHDGAKQVAEKVSAALVKTIYNEHNRHHTLFENYRIDGPIQENEVGKLIKSSTSTLGGLTTLLRWYGTRIGYAAGNGHTDMGTSDLNKSEAPGESDMSISTSDMDVSMGKRPIDTSTAAAEDDPNPTKDSLDLNLQDTPDGKKRKVEDDIEKTPEKLIGKP